MSSESSEDVFNIVAMFVKGFEDVEQNIDRAHHIEKSYNHTKFEKKV